MHRSVSDSHVFTEQKDHSSVTQQTPAQQAERRERNAERMRQKRRNESEQEKAEGRHRNTSNMNKKRRAESHEEAAARREKNADNMKKMRQAESNDEIAARRERNAYNMNQKCRAESHEEAAARRERDANNKIRKRQAESHEEAAARRERDANNKIRKRQAESHDEIASRRERNADNIKKKRQAESREEAAARRERDANNKIRKRRAASHDEALLRNANNMKGKRTVKSQEAALLREHANKHDKITGDRKDLNRTHSGTRKITKKGVNREQNENKAHKTEDTEGAIHNFKKAMEAGPSYVCTVCHRLMYKCSVKPVSKDSLEVRYKNSCRLIAEMHRCNIIRESKHGLHVCNTCDGALKCGRLPAQAKLNGLQLSSVPEELQQLTALERQLISTRIPFMKLLSLPRGRQQALHGPVVNVPAKFDKICMLLPRIPKSAALLRIKLKRQLKYKGHCMYQLVRPPVIKNALKWLQANNILYRNVTINHRWQEEWTEQDKDLWSAMTVSPYRSAEVHKADGITTDCIMNKNTEDVYFEDYNSENTLHDVEPDDENHQPVTEADGGQSFMSCRDEILTEDNLLSTLTVPSDAESHNYVGQPSANKTLQRSGNQDVKVQHSECDSKTDEQHYQPVTKADSGGAVTNQVHGRQADDKISPTETTISDEEYQREDQVALDGDTATCGNPFDSCFHINNVETKTFSIAPSEGETPLPIFFDEVFEEGCNPDKYPYGRGGLGSKRTVKLTAKKYFNQRILDSDGRFARDVQYLHIAQYAVESKSIQDQIRIAFRKIKRRKVNGEHITAGLLKNNEHINQLIHSDQAFKFMKNVRGSPAYWQRVFYDVLAMVRQLGCPTWFISLSAADLHWPELIKLIAGERGRQLTDDDVKLLSWVEKCQILRDNPVTAARQFNYRVDKFFSLFLKSNSNPIGKVTEYFIRIEFQARGSPHAHALIWIENAPKIDEDSDEEVCQFVDRYIRCSATPTQEDVKQEVGLQQHRHSSTCRRGFDKSCRFHYPQLPSRRTLIRRPPEDIENVVHWMTRRGGIVEAVKEQISKNEVVSVKTLDDILQACGIDEDYYHKVLAISMSGKDIVMKRNTTDLWTNNYNPDILRSWRGNMDIQYITDAYACIMYIVSYACKAENSMSEMLHTAAKDSANDDIRTQMKKVAATFLNHQEISAQEAAYRLLSLYLKKMSRTVVYVNTNQKDNRVCLSKPFEEIEGKKNDDRDLFFMSIHDKYSSRPKELANMCLAEFATNYRSVSVKRVDDHLHDDEVEDDVFSTEPGSVIKLEDNCGLLCRRKHTAILRYHRFNAEKEEEKHFYSKLLLYLPWRDEEKDLINCISEGKTYKDMHDENEEVITSNENKFNICGSSIDDALEVLEKGNNEERWDELYPEAQQEAAECGEAGVTVESNIHADDIEANTNMVVGSKATSTDEQVFSIHRQPDEMSDSDYTALLNSLNTEQITIVTRIRQWCENVAESFHTKQARPPPFYSFVSGPGGVGKSHVIKAVYETCRKLLKSIHADDPDAPTVLLTAPTGVAAYNIGGVTLHSAFLLNTQHGYQSLSSERQQLLHNMLQHVHLVIIDEISMVGSQTLFDIHRRLKEIMNRSDYDDSVFGGISVMAVGDLYQLQPVKQKYVFELPTEPYAKLFGCLWDKFTLYELTISMRQSDQEFADMLSRLRTATVTAQDVAVLSSRILSENITYPTEAMHVFATNAKTDEYNNNKLSTLPGPHYTIHATDSKTDNNTGQLTITMPTKSCDTGGLKGVLVLTEGARVMLCSNLDVSDGLVNGARGEIAEFEFDKDENIKTIFVKFDNPKVGVRAGVKSNTGVVTPIRKIEVKFGIGRRKAAEVARSQFPLQLAWATTIHKVQGITTEKIVVSFEGHFGPGQAYVALSRVKSLEGLYIRDFNSKKIICSNRVHQHMAELRTRGTVKTQDILESNELRFDDNVIGCSVDDTDRCHHSADSHGPYSTSSNTETNTDMYINDSTSFVASFSMFQTFKYTSVDEEDKIELCNKLQLYYAPNNTRHNMAMVVSRSKEVEQLILQHSHQQVNATIHHVLGDGNCLFRSLSLGISNTEEHHFQLRQAITDHQLQHVHSAQLTKSSILHMKQLGKWGTDHEIIAAANLLSCCIVCCSKYGSSNKLCLQHFSPHMLICQDCASHCKHKTLFLINGNGGHYDSVSVVRKSNSSEE